MTPNEEGHPDLPVNPQFISPHEPGRDTLMPLDLRGTLGNIAERVDEGIPASPDFASPLTVENLFRALRYRWPSALVLGILLGSASAIAAWFLLPPKYTASVLLQIASAEPLLLPDTFRAGLDSAYYQNTQVALIKSRPIILAALRKR